MTSLTNRGAGLTTYMDKKRLEYYKKKLLTRREELLKTIARTEEEGEAEHQVEEHLVGERPADQQQGLVAAVGADEGHERHRIDHVSQREMAHRRQREPDQAKPRGQQGEDPGREAITHERRDADRRERAGGLL